MGHIHASDPEPLRLSLCLHRNPRALAAPPATTPSTSNIPSALTGRFRSVLPTHMSNRRWSRHPALIFLFVFSAGLTVFLVHSTGIFSDDQDYCSPSTKMPGVECCRFESVERLNQRLTGPLHDLLKTPFFRYFKVALDKPCPFWRQDGLCTSKQCSIRIMEKKPNSWDATSISDVNYPSHELDPLLIKRWETDYDEFCTMDRECDNGVFVDLIENPERFTGYAGEDANKIWRSIYEENCFTPTRQNNPLANSDWNKCEERQLFYRIVSGLHASISTHLAYEWFNQKTNAWEANFDIFHQRVGKFPDRLGNMYFDYMLLYRAVTKLGKYLRKLKFNSDDADEEEFIQTAIRNITELSPDCPRNFDRILFASNSKPHIVDEMRKRFRNITTIMDCVSCERCRLWGKVQTLGVGTALKVLYASENKAQWSRMSLRRCEIVALFNVFGRVAESIEAVGRFREEYKQRLEHQEQFKQSFYSSANAILLITLMAAAVLMYVGIGYRKQARKMVTIERTRSPRKKEQ